MEDLRLRGYVTPEDFQGSDFEKIQQAVSVAEEQDIRKVLIEKQYSVERPIAIPEQMHIVFAEGAKLKADGLLFVNKNTGNEKRASWSFEEQRIYFSGSRDAVLEGDLSFFHAGYVVLEDLDIKGSVSFEFCREIRMERNSIEAAGEYALELKRGCNNFIVQYNSFKAADTAIVINAAAECGPYVVGKDVDMHELIIRENNADAPVAVRMLACPDAGIFNVQLDHTTCPGTGLIIGGTGFVTSEERYFNITATDFTGAKEAVLLNNRTKHCYFGE